MILSRPLYAIILIIFLNPWFKTHGSQPVTFLQSDDLLPTSVERRAEMGKILDTHLEEINKHVVQIVSCKEFKWLPGYYIKSNLFNRIQGAHTLNQTIQDNNLKLVTVPEKWLHPLAINFQSKQLPQKSVVVAKKIEGAYRQKMNIEQAMEICCLLKHAKYDGKHYSDTHDCNLLFCPDGKVAFIDTETKGFYNTSPVSGVEGILQWHMLDQEAKSFIEQELDEIKEKYTQNEY